MPLAIQAGLWGLLAGSALLIGAAVGYYARVPARVVAGVMAFGSGVLISALAFDLMDEAFRRGGLASTGVGFAGGALAYTVANQIVSARGGRHRKRSGPHQGAEAGEEGGGGLAIAVGALLDGVPESVVIGLSLLDGEGVGLVAVTAVFLSNLPEGLSSAARMRKAGRSAGYVFGVWGGIALACGLSSLAGFVIFGHFSPGVVAATTAVAAGAILAMLADTMIPEAFEEVHAAAGLITAAGFLAAFALSKWAG